MYHVHAITTISVLGFLPGLGKLLRAAFRTDIGSIYKLTQDDKVRKSQAYRLAEKTLSEKKTRDHIARIVYLPPLHLFWSLRGQGKTPAERLHRAYCQELWNDRNAWERCSMLLMYLAWPFAVPLAMLWATNNNGRIIAARTGKSIPRQLGEELSVAARHGILPPWYYIFELYDDSKREHAGEYLCRYETKGGLYRLAKAGHRTEQRYPLQDKVEFAAHCAKHGLPAVPAYLIAGEGELHWPEGSSGHLPERDLFFKPARGRGGTGAEVWRYRGDGSYCRTNGEIASESELQERLRGKNETYIVQPRLTNHAAILDLSIGTLATVRMLTILDEYEKPVATHAVFRMAVGDNLVVDNFHAGGIAAKIDMKTGVLGRATDIGLRAERGWCDRHPDTGGQIVGRCLPFWRETVEAAEKGHAAFPGRVLIGWDIAITDDGPVLVEGNAAPDVDLIQRPYGEPLGNSRFGELLDYHLEHPITAREIHSP
ncbi:MAG: sugar-transfer associated ATP-grasp domain-containing protein [Hyphomicrobiales bacterium]